MKRISIAAVIMSTFFVMGAAAQTLPAPRPATPAPATQTPPALPTPRPAQPATPPAAPVPFPAGAKVAFVNMQVIVADSKLGKSGQDRMKTLHDANTAKLSQRAKDIQALQAKIQSQQGVVNDATMQQSSRDLERMQREATTAQQQTQADEQNLNDDLLADFSKKALPIIEALRIERDLWVIFAVQDTNDSGGGLAVASASQGLDLSAEVVKRLDASSTIPGGKN